MSPPPSSSSRTRDRRHTGTTTPTTTDSRNSSNGNSHHRGQNHHHQQQPHRHNNSKMNGGGSVAGAGSVAGVPDDDNVTTNDYYEFSHTKEKQQNDHEDEIDDFMMRIMDGTCQGVFPDQATCQSVLPACQARIEEQLDLLTHCRQPLGFLSFFQEHHGQGSTRDVGVEVLPAGVYAVPPFCEYCGSESVRDCDPKHCPRPALYFQKKRPPFSKPNPALWNPVTDHAIMAAASTPVVNNSSAKDGGGGDENDDSKRDTPTPSSWVSGFFRDKTASS